MKRFFYISISILLFSCNGFFKSETNNQDEKSVKINLLVDPLSLKQKANEFYTKDNYSDALKCFDQLLLKDSTNGEYYFKRAFCKTLISSYDSTAIQDYLKSIALNYEQKQKAYLNIAVGHRFKALFRCTTSQEKKEEYKKA